ncbi:prolipoprotein diacylglyceryl transferase family protein [Paenibacillus glacialis]|uniref:prolipoprotein diacylglyceryl transferase family protein n=1 Tax=Paenibacillus glacialis TaxID=494026 RepID=UPI001FDF176C|nr:prolipoprotein diacylglyceryl transferase family protein [Paenibacillus glacialis]
MAPAIILGQAIGRIACFLNGDAFGAPTDSGFGIVYPEGTIAFERYGSVPLWPAEIWEGQLDIVVFGILIVMKNIELPVGVLFLSYNVLYSIVRFSMDGWTMGEYLCIGISVILILYFIVRSRKVKPIALMG